MPICENCQCVTNELIYPQWKPQGTVWCSKCINVRKLKVYTCHKCHSITNDHIYPQWLPKGTLWCLPCLEQIKINPLSEGMTSIEENTICTE